MYKAFDKTVCFIYNINGGGEFMDEEAFVITEFLSISKPINHQGISFYINKRESSALIFPIHGKIEFSWETGKVIADADHPVFIQEGMSYLNSCMENAQSIMINIKAKSNKEKIFWLLPPDREHLQKCFNEIIVLNANPTARKRSRIFEKIYQLLGECFPYEPGDNNSLLSPALETIEKFYNKSDLTLDFLAESCNISKSYIHKLFRKEFGMTPFQYITRIRMNQAKTLLLEMFPVGEVALMVGYSDIYQFSRAFKRFYKISPDKFRFSRKPM